MPTLTDTLSTIKNDVGTNTSKLDTIEVNAKDDQLGTEVPFDNTGTGMAATDVESAIKEVDTRLDVVETSQSQGAAGVSYDNTSSGLTATNSQAAIDEVDSRLNVTESKLAGIEPDAKDDQSAAEVPYDNTSSGMLATDTQGAIDEVESRVVTTEAKLANIEENAKDDQLATDVPYDNTNSGLVSSEVQGAIDELDTRLDSAEVAINDVEAAIDSSTWVVRAPKAIYPLDGSIDIPATFTLDATPYANAFGTTRDYREFEVDLTTGDFTSPVYTFQGDVNSHSIVTPLYTENQYKWRCRDVSTTGEVSPWMQVAVFNTVLVYVEMPSLAITGYPVDIPENPTLTTSAFSVANGTDTHASTTWVVKRASDNVTVFESVNDTFNLLSIQVPLGILEENTPYIFQAQHVGASEGASGFITEVGDTLNNFPFIDAPSLSVQGEPANVDEEPTLTGSAFNTSFGVDTHLHTNWRIEKTFDDSLVWESLTNTTNLESIQVPPGNLLEGVQYRFMVQYVGTTYGASEWTEVIASTKANFATVVTPIVSVTGSPSSVTETPTISTSGFATYSGSDTHLHTSWRVVRESDDVVVWSSLNDTVNKTSINVPAGNLVVNTAYRFEAQHTGTTFGNSDYGTVTATTALNFVYVDDPVLTVEGSPSDVPETPTLSTNAFSVVNGSDTHASTDWEVRTMADALVWQQLASGSLLSINVPSGTLSTSTQYKFRVRHNGTTEGSSNWVEVTATTASVFSIPVDDVFSTYAYTGYGSSSRNINNGINLNDFGGAVFIKSRNSTSAITVFDTERGVGTNYAFSLTTNDGAGQSELTGGINNFNTNGFNVGNSSLTNGNGAYVAHTFRKSPKFFDIITYTGDGTNNRSIPHNLGIAPGMVITKCISDPSLWNVYHRSLGSTNSLRLDTDAAQSTVDSLYTEPSSTDFKVKHSVDQNLAGEQYVAYLFAHDTDVNDGIIKCGLYSGDREVNLGWEPQYVLTKRTDTLGDWQIIDTTRGITSLDGVDPVISFNLGAGESLSNTGAYLTATGFKGIGTVGNHIYVAIRKPNKTPLNASDVFALDTGTANVFPSFYSGFQVDTVLNRVVSATDTPILAMRKLGDNKALNTTSRGGAFTYNTAGFGYSEGCHRLTNTGNIYYSWMFKDAPGFMDTITYKGNGVSGRQLKHSLGVVPELIITARLDTAGSVGFTVGHKDLLSNYTGLRFDAALYLNLITDKSNNTGIWGDSISTTFYEVTNSSDLNASGGEYVSLLFATLPGISKVGSYTGNGANQDINCDFNTGARFIMIKRTDSLGAWYLWDTLRGIVTGNDPHLSLNTTSAQVTGDDSIDPLVTGFTVNQNATTDINTSGGSYIFLAIA